MKSYKLLSLLVILAVIATAAQPASAAIRPLPPRQTVNFDGTWEIEQGGMETAPTAFSHTVVVPGLVDMAQPAFAEVGRNSELREAFWYRRTFTVDGPVPAVAILKIHKAQYRAKVFLNGQLLGEHLPCFTPAMFDVKPYLKGEGQTNELVVRLAAQRNAMPKEVPSGWDFEKYLFIPGIFDSVELMLTGAPYIANVQVVPDVAGKAVRVVAEVQVDQSCYFTVKMAVCEAASGKTVGSAMNGPVHMKDRGQTTVDVTIPIRNCRLWSPEDPFLYELKIGTGSDAAKVRLGMRSFTFDPTAKRAMLNGKPYYMRGTNVTLYRFFEDAERGNLPWQADWVRRLHQKYKGMNWNSIRYCIGFPPEFWYDIADEEGLLIQDEFPIWLLGGAPDRPTSEELISEYTDWMRERWNHPCVVIWDSQNESRTKETGKAIQAVRGLDLSNRPWENGWAEPQAATDCVESHPYLFSRNNDAKQKPFFLKDLEKTPTRPHLSGDQNRLAVPIIINEYDWLWLNRDGSPTILTKKVYESLLGPDSTVQQRRMLHARYVAALTEFWRCHRQAAAVLHFCGLGYSRPGDKPRPEGGATCDDFIDIRNLTFEPLFEQHVREAFHPVGLMLDFWAEEVPAGETRPLKVILINDLDKDWSGPVRVRIMKGEKQVSVTSQDGQIAAFGQETLAFDVAFPKEPGDYTIVAEISDARGKPVRSMRDFKVK